MLKFVEAASVANTEGMKFKPAENSSLSGEDLGTLTMMVLHRFMEQVDWANVVEVYLSGLVDTEDKALIKRAVSALVAGGIEFNA